MARRIVLHSPLDPVALATRLKERVPATVDDKTVAQVIGHGSDMELTLFYYRPNFRNDLAARMTATIEPEGSGSLIEGRIGTPTFGLVFMGCWMVFVLHALIVGVAVVSMVREASLFIIIPGGMLVFGLLFAWIALRHRERDAAAIRAFLAETVEAR